jgi:hypothetical protein
MKAANSIAVGLMLLLVLQFALLLDRQARARVGGSARNYEVGDPLASLTLTDAGGKETTLADVVGDSCRLLVVFSESCIYCRDVAVLWSGRELVGDFVPVTWISLAEDRSKAQDFIAKNRLPTEWYELGSIEDAYELGVFGTPMTIMAGPGASFLGIAETHPDSVRLDEPCG